ncbi:mandelate racemase/muconate lactonizing enzyme family protein [Actinacidiphila acididurans]|uniref:Mandelate racemase/muconate lactonizing enzyme family protein n=1 Tax=Actinacidiphila acididurans TaxID=2784346 RepID=A0ABS2TV22_9ACTN|nr:mandelate racemase/muconate lactonizing enzyme family protein [Actinacidiphila acididurans]MBM9506351.1 mandelate racemase/muconate lactonizing enzyme family protein [Actinacidiphila acididurans]
MSTITRAEAYLVDLPVEAQRTDAVQSFLKQETVFVEITTADGGQGTGYSYTIGTGGTAVLALLRDYLLPRLPGQDARRVEAVWLDLFSATRATAVGAITSLALAAVDTALWDLRGRQTGLPLWLLAGGARDRIPLYDTEVGWLHLTEDELVAGARQAVERGLRGIKVKIGKPSATEDAERLAAVRRAVGPDVDLMVDANQSMTAAEAVRRAALLEPAGLLWLEEPLPADDIAGHAALAAATSIPVAVGESLYSAGQFAQYLRQGAAGIVQADVARIGGITPWLKVAHLAEAHNVPMCPHFLMELHVSLAAAVPGGRYLEYIPQLTAITRTPLTVRDGMAHVPAAPGLGIDWDRDAIDALRKE